MRNTLIATFAAATIALALAGSASATTSVKLSALPAVAAGHVRQAVNVCGNHGCAPVQVSRPHKRQGHPPPTMATRRVL